MSSSLITKTLNATETSTFGNQTTKRTANLARRGTRKRQLLVVVNPYASTVSDRLKHLVVYALQSRYQVTAVETESKNHATEIARRAAHDGVELVVAFGGDGTVNEVVNGLAGTDVPISVLPGGSTNVFSRTLGIPRDIVQATEHLLKLGDDLVVRRVDLGCVNDRYFTFGSGIGIDADAVKHIDVNPWLKGRLGEFYYGYWLLRAFYSGYLGKPPIFEVSRGAQEKDQGVSLVVQNCMPYAYFGSSPLHVCENVDLRSGTLSYTVLDKARQVDLPTIMLRLLSQAKVSSHHSISHTEGVTGFSVEAQADESGKPQLLPLHVDGDFIGHFQQAHYSVVPKALPVVA